MFHFQFELSLAKLSPSLVNIWVILWRHFENFMVIFVEYYTDIWVISGRCLGDWNTAQIEPQYFPNSTLISPKYHLTSAQISSNKSPRYHPNVTQISTKYHSNITQISPKYYPKYHLDITKISPGYSQNIPII